MFVYNRKVSFIDYYINGIKSGNIGVVRRKVTGEGVSFQIELMGMETWRNGRIGISVGNGYEKKKLFEMDIKEGKGSGNYHVPLEELKGGDYSKIIFELGSDCYGLAELCDLPKEDTEEEVMPPVCEEDDEILQDELLADCMEPQPDKWEVIKKKYPILYPFKGQGAYVSIKPVDLQLLNKKYHHLSSNSYLMHGFYQYRHMILGEYAQEKGTFFYVGVPGEFVKKEQTSAAMFGFEGYEHSGDLGYYLYRVEL